MPHCQTDPFTRQLRPSLLELITLKSNLIAPEMGLQTELPEETHSLNASLNRTNLPLNQAISHRVEESAVWRDFPLVFNEKSSAFRSSSSKSC
jgi:hypothetical protein